uniref:Saposin B-type domain-containing protein n=1 Tax=Strongyloides venezuelensis TaxID=75913 RepID=A0A0K0FI46_STRVS
MKFLIFFLLSVIFFSKLKGNFICDACIALVDEIKQLLDQDEVDIIDKAANLCDKVTSGKQPFDSLCREYVIREGDEIIKKIEKDSNSTVVCIELHLCQITDSKNLSI